MKISATIITKDEERTLPKCIENIRPVVDEIVVVDSGSTDSTKSLADQLADVSIVHPFRDFSDQKNYAASLARFRWILNVDADELLTAELKERILDIKKQEQTGCSAFCFPRKTFGPDGKMLFNIVSYPGFHYRLYDRDLCRWRRPVHETLEISGKKRFCPEHMLHYPNYDLVPRKEDLYARLKEAAAAEQKRPLRETAANFWFHFRALFIDLEFYRKGWRYWLHGARILFHMAGLRFKS